MPREATLLRWGALAGIVASVAGVLANAAHPRVGSGELNDVPAVLDKVAASGPWRAVHLATLVTVLLALAAIGAILRSVAVDTPSPWPLVALVSTAITTPLLLVPIGIDGFALPAMADRWADDGPQVLATAQALRDLDIAVLNVVMIGHFGLTAILLGVATWTSPSYGPRVAALALAGGVLGIACGLIQALSGELTALSYLWLLTIFLLLITLWLLWASSVLLRRLAGTVAAQP